MCSWVQMGHRAVSATSCAIWLLRFRCLGLHVGCQASHRAVAPLLHSTAACKQASSAALRQPACTSEACAWQIRPSAAEPPIRPVLQLCVFTGQAGSCRAPGCELAAGAVTGRRACHELHLRLLEGEPAAAQVLRTAALQHARPLPCGLVFCTSTAMLCLVCSRWGDMHLQSLRSLLSVQCCGCIMLHPQFSV